MDKGKNRRRKEGEAIGKSQWERGNREIARGERNEAKSKIQRAGCKRQRAMGKGSEEKRKRQRARGKGKEAKGKRQRVSKTRGAIQKGQNVSISEQEEKQEYDG